MVTNAPDPEALERLIGFGRDLRRRGLPVGTGRIVTFCRAAGALGLLERDDLYWAGRSSLISRRSVLPSTATMPTAYLRAVPRPSAPSRAARSHNTTSPTRIIR